MFFIMDIFFPIAIVFFYLVHKVYKNVFFCRQNETNSLKNRKDLYLKKYRVDGVLEPEGFVILRRRVNVVLGL